MLRLELVLGASLSRSFLIALSFLTGFVIPSSDMNCLAAASMASSRSGVWCFNQSWSIQFWNQYRGGFSLLIFRNSATKSSTLILPRFSFPSAVAFKLNNRFLNCLR